MGGQARRANDCIRPIIAKAILTNTIPPNNSSSIFICVTYLLSPNFEVFCQVPLIPLNNKKLFSYSYAHFQIETQALALLKARGPLGPLRYRFFITVQTIKGIEKTKRLWDRLKYS